MSATTTKMDPGTQQQPQQQQQQQQHAPLEIDSADVIRIMLQFMKENNLRESMRALSSESGVSLNTIESVDSFLSDIYQGKWDSVLAQVNNLKISRDKLYLLYEQVIFELLEIGDRNCAKELLNSTEVMQTMKSDQPGTVSERLLLIP
jgi:WD40 repeat-containing protein SMU1